MTLPERFRTSRLLLSRFTLADTAELAGMHRDPRVAETLGGVRADAETARLAADLAAHWDQHGFGWWTVRDPESGRFIGRGGLRRVMLEGAAEIELAYGLVPEYWGRGLATELAKVAVAQGIVRLGIAEIVGYTLPANAASRRVMEKTGFIHERGILHAGMPHLLFRLTARAWRTAPLSARPSALEARAGQAVAA